MRGFKEISVDMCIEDVVGTAGWLLVEALQYLRYDESGIRVLWKDTFRVDRQNIPKRR